MSAIAEWFDASPTAEPVRTDLISSDSDSVSGYGAGAGDVERYSYPVPMRRRTAIQRSEAP